MEKLISDYTVAKVESGCAPVSGKYGLQISTVEDISPVFPYLNAELEETRYDHQNQILIWKESDRAYALRPHEIVLVTDHGMDNPEGIAKLVRETIDRVNKTWQERDKITPDTTEKLRPSVIDFFKLLPETNCKQCGCATCLVFASDLRESTTSLEKCPPLQKSENAENRRQLENLVMRLK